MCSLATTTVQSAALPLTRARGALTIFLCAFGDGFVDDIFKKSIQHAFGLHISEAGVAPNVSPSKTANSRVGGTLNVVMHCLVAPSLSNPLPALSRPDTIQVVSGVQQQREDKYGAERKQPRHTGTTATLCPTRCTEDELMPNCQIAEASPSASSASMNALPQ